MISMHLSGVCKRCVVQSRLLVVQQAPIQVNSNDQAIAIALSGESARVAELGAAIHQILGDALLESA